MRAGLLRRVTAASRGVTFVPKLGRGLRTREKNATEGGAGRFEKTAPDARAAPPEAHESLIGRKTVEEVPLTGLSFVWKLFVGGVLAAGFIAFPAAVSGAVIYQENFDGLGSTNLAGLAPDIAPGSQTWGGATQFKANGFVSSAFAGIHLPFTPSPGFTDTLTGSFQVNSIPVVRRSRHGCRDASIHDQPAEPLGRRHHADDHARCIACESRQLEVFGDAGDRQHELHDLDQPAGEHDLGRRHHGDRHLLEFRFGHLHELQSDVRARALDDRACRRGAGVGCCRGGSAAALIPPGFGTTSAAPVRARS